MAKSKKRTAGKSTAKPAAKPAAAPAKADRGVDRRQFLRRARDYGIIAALVGGGGYWLVTDIQAHNREHDLTRIGQGAPSVVQIHDPSCPMCRRLQAEARQALEAFPEGQIEYVVADINTSEGRRLAATNGVGHVTLLLFDGNGRRRDVLTGVRTAPELERSFRRLVRQSAATRRPAS